MKVGILTFPHSPSLGAMLQMGALYRTVEEMGHDVEIINYVSEKVNHKQVQEKTLKAVLIKILSALFIKSPAQSYCEFESKLKMFPTKTISSENDMEKAAKHFDRIIVGSDQVWNPVVTGHDLNFYLKFCKDSCKKASYAASFGYMQADNEYSDKIAELLKDFKYLSVREKDGQKIVKDLTGRKAELVLDPTLLVEKKYFQDIKISNNRKKKYVLFFCIKPSRNLYNIAELYASKYGYELVTIGGRMIDKFNPRKHPAYGIGPKEFLGLIDGAQCVFTNSFHGMAVSVALNRDFFVEFSSDTNSRLINLTDMLDLKDRVVNDTVPIEKKINYVHVEQLLEQQRTTSKKYLDYVLNDKRSIDE